jgi:hypothetical protein
MGALLKTFMSTGYQSQSGMSFMELFLAGNTSEISGLFGIFRF